MIEFNFFYVGETLYLISASPLNILIIIIFGKERSKNWGDLKDFFNKYTKLGRQTNEWKDKMPTFMRSTSRLVKGSWSKELEVLFHSLGTVLSWHVSNLKKWILNFNLNTY